MGFVLQVTHGAFAHSCCHSEGHLTAMEKMLEGTATAADRVVRSFSKLAQSFHDKHTAFNGANHSQGN